MSVAFDEEIALAAQRSFVDSLPGQQPSSDFNLAGDSDFQVTDLPLDGTREAYQRYLDWLDNDVNPIEVHDLTGMAESGSTMRYGHALVDHFGPLVLNFRATGHLKLLDRMWELCDLMRQPAHGSVHCLIDRWVNPNNNQLVTPNNHPSAPANQKSKYQPTVGLRRWTRKMPTPTSSSAWGTDYQDLHQMLAHGGFSAMPYALHINRELSSPSDYDYGEMADFWFDYLKNDFVKIREVAETNDIRTYNWHNAAHPLAHAISCFHYLWKYFGEQKWLTTRDHHVNRFRTHQAFWYEDATFGAPAGSKFAIWEQQPATLGHGITPLDYFAQTMAVFPNLHYEGVPLFDEDWMQALANTAAWVICDSATPDHFPFDMGGFPHPGDSICPNPSWSRAAVNRFTGEQRTMPSRCPWDHSSLTYERTTQTKRSNDGWWILSAWDPSGRIAQAGEAVQTVVDNNNPPRRGLIVGGLAFARLKAFYAS